MRVRALLFLFIFSVPVQCLSKTQEKYGQIYSLYLLVKVVCFLKRNFFTFCQFCTRAISSRRMNYSDGLRSLLYLSSLLKTFFVLAESEETTTPTTSPDHNLSGEETSSIGCINSCKSRNFIFNHTY